jgi:hypothetical protein
MKVHGGFMPHRTFKMERSARGSRMVKEETRRWHLRIDLIPPENYYPDPTGNGLYEIHWCERDLHEVLAASEGEDAIYDRAAVLKLLETDNEKPDDEKREAEAQNQLDATPPSVRKKVHITEFWGTLLNQDGTVKMANCVCTIANDKIVIRKPEPNPFWHQESPFCVTPITRVPFSVWHRALYDNAVNLNLAINEMFNLMLDGGMASVWGIRQVRVEDLEDPSEVAGGVPQGATLKVKGTLPPGQKVLETVATGEVPRDAMAIFEFLNREYTGAVLTNETKLGNLPAKQVRSTEIVEASQSQAITLDGMVMDMEEFIAKVIRLSWYTVLQNMDDIPLDALQSVTDRQIAILLNNASPEERFQLFFGKAKFRVTGISAVMAKALDFQKKIALGQAVASNPILMRAFIMEYSGSKILRSLMRDLNLDIEEMRKSQEELLQTAQEMQDVERLSGVTGGGGGQSAAGAAGNGGTPAEGAGEGSAPAAEINQLAAARSGLTPNA